VSHCDCREKFAVISDAAGVSRVGATELEESHELRHVAGSFNSARHAPAAASNTHEFIFWQAPCAHCQAGEIAGDRVYIFKPLYEQGRDVPLGFAAFTLNPDYLRRQFFADLTRGASAGEGWDELVFSVSDEAGAEVLSGGGGVDYEARASLAPVLPRWVLAAGYRDATAATLARANFRVGLLLTLSVLCCLGLGVVLILRTTFREMKLAEAKSAFVSNVSHELKTPLALIRLFAETLELGRVKDDAKAREYYRVISRESGRLTGLIDNVLDFSQIEAGRKEYHFARTDAGEVVREVVRDYDYRLSAAGFELRLDVAAGLPAVLADRGALAQVVLNLLDNAVRYSPNSKEVGVRVCARGRGVAVEVSDRGIGIPRSEHEKIFDKFYRVGDGLVHATKGSGLGLSLVRHIVRAHGGRVTLDSAPGRGSRFTIYLPEAPAAGPGGRAEDVGVAENTHR
jgi:signal transduction histidine kinase